MGSAKDSEWDRGRLGRAIAIEEKEKMEMMLGRDMGREGTNRVDRSVKNNLRKAMDKRRRWMELGMRIQCHCANLYVMAYVRLMLIQ